jgi:hypothetical protein
VIAGVRPYPTASPARAAPINPAAITVVRLIERQSRAARSPARPPPIAYAA